DPRAGEQAKRVADRLGQYDPAGLVNNGFHGKTVPSKSQTSRRARYLAAAPRCRIVRSSDADDDLAPGVPFGQVADGRRGLAERVAPVDGRGYRSGVCQIPEGHQVGAALPGDEGGQLLAHEGGQQLSMEVAADAAEQGAAVLAAGDDQRPLRGQDPAQVRQPSAAADIDDHVVAAPPGGKVLAGVVEDVV